MELSQNKNSNKMKKVTFILLLLLTLQCKSQFLTVKQAETLMGKVKFEATTIIANYGYKKTMSSVSDMLTFEKNYELGNMTLTIAILNGKINAISWTIHPIMLDQFRREAMSEGFSQKEIQAARVLPFINIKRGLLLNFIDNTANRNEVVLVLGKSSQSDINQYKNVHPSEYGYKGNSEINLQEPNSIFKMPYSKIIDSLVKKKIAYKCDSAFGESIFYGYYLHTKDGLYFLNDKYHVLSYGFQFYKPIDMIKEYLINKGAILTKEEKTYCKIMYRGYYIELNTTGEGETRVEYQKR
ncbi:MAG: hypothetical protein JST29_01485 [Bacteroidetes bacterium]|nr:hypothetical protein [Bacteroidota bacterium]